jgi:hypothetical protein
MTPRKFSTNYINHKNVNQFNHMWFKLGPETITNSCSLCACEWITSTLQSSAVANFKIKISFNA